VVIFRAEDMLLFLFVYTSVCAFLLLRLDRSADFKLFTRA